MKVAQAERVVLINNKIMCKYVVENWSTFMNLLCLIILT